MHTKTRRERGGGLVALFLLLACAGKAPGGAAPGTPQGGAVPGTSSSSAASGAVVAGARAAGGAEEAPLPIDPAMRVAQLSNGLRYYVRAHRKPEKRASLRLAVNVGSVLEGESDRGLAHFVEHMAFNGTRLFRKQEMVEFIEKIGMRFGHDANASTSFDETIYTFEVPTDDAAVLEKALVVLQQIASDVLFEADEVDRERAVVIEEWRLGRGPMMRILDKVLPVIFRASRYAERVPIGTKAILEKANAEDLRRFYRRWYRPDLMAVVVVGDFDAKVIEAQVRKVFEPIPAPATRLERPIYPVPEHAETLVAAVQDKELQGTMVNVLHKLPHRPLASESDYRRHLAESLYHDMLNGRLDELTRVAEPPFLGAVSSTQHLVRPIDLLAQGAMVKQDGVARGLESLTREVERVDRHGFTAGELQRAKAERLRGIDAAVKEREKLPASVYADEAVRHFLVAEGMPGVQAELALHQKYLPTITLEELNALARQWITERNRVIFIQAPTSATLPNEATLLSLFKKVEAETIAAYEDRVGQGKLVDRLPKAGRIARTTSIAEIGVTEWRLSNGVRVVLKPTDFKNDEVRLVAFSPGGNSRVPDRDYLSAVYADEIVGSSGAGRFGPAELRKALAGKLVGVGPYIAELEEGLRGSASPDDLETLFQLIYLTFTAPRRDEAAFAALRAQLREHIANRQAHPELSFVDRHESTLYKNHLRRRQLVPGDDEKIKLDRAITIFRDRFADAGGFTFVLVGRFEPAQIEPLVRQYLATLPSRGGKETWRDVGARPVEGQVHYDVKKGVEPKSTVMLTFTGRQKWSREEDFLLEALVEGMGMRLREVLRERLGGTYGVQMSGDLARRPIESYRIDVMWSCAPENVAKLVDAVKAELESAKKTPTSPADKTGGLGSEYLDKIKAAQRRAFEEAVKTNELWLSELAHHYRFGTDPRLILQREKLIDGLTTERLSQAAGRYFDFRRSVLGVLSPETSERGALMHRRPQRLVLPTASSAARTEIGSGL